VLFELARESSSLGLFVAIVRGGNVAREEGGDKGLELGVEEGRRCGL
jgi:hypothetical protein